MKVCSSIISSLNRLAEEDIRLAADSIDAIVSCMQRAKQGFHEDMILHENLLYEGVNLIAPNETDLKAVLQTMGLEHLIRKN